MVLNTITFQELSLSLSLFISLSLYLSVRLSCAVNLAASWALVWVWPKLGPGDPGPISAPRSTKSACFAHGFFQPSNPFIFRTSALWCLLWASAALCQLSLNDVLIALELLSLGAGFCSSSMSKSEASLVMPRLKFQDLLKGQWLLF